MRFLCFHGRGTNSRVLEIQTAALRHEIGDTHTYDFVEGTVPDELEPALRSIYPTDDQYFDFWEDGSAESLKTSIQFLDKFIQDEGPYDGAIAFSRGAFLVSTYLMYKMFHKPNEDLPFKTLIFLSGIPPASPKDLDLGTMKLYDDVGKDQPPVNLQIRIPSVHIYDTADPAWPGMSDRLVKACDPATSVVFHHALGHSIPGAKDTDALLGSAKAVMRLVDMVA